MIGRLINLPFKVLGKVSRAVQERNDAAMKAQHGEGLATDNYDAFEDKDTLGEPLPEDFDPGPLEQDAARVLADLRDGREILFVDVRKGAPFRAGHIQGALSMPLGTVHIRLAELPPDVRVILYCDDGKKSRDATIFVRYRGLEDTWTLSGGLPAWRRAGGEVQGSSR